MYDINYEYMIQKQNNQEVRRSSRLIPGMVKIEASEQTLELNRIPEYVKKQYQEFMKLKNKEKLTYYILNVYHQNL
jgi:hypothetical protein